MPTRVERFLAHLDRVSGGGEPLFFPIDSTRPGLLGVTVIVYEDLPEPGMITGITYGVSLADHPEWRFGKPELCISVQSTDLNWPIALGYIGEAQRGINPFHYGDTITFSEVTPESEMTSFVMFAPAVLAASDFRDIDVGETVPINLVALYPIHDRERRYIYTHGLEAFWKRDWDAFNVQRPSVV